MLLRLRMFCHGCCHSPHLWVALSTDVVWPTPDYWEFQLSGYSNTPLQPTLRRLLYLLPQKIYEIFNRPPVSRFVLEAYAPCVDFFWPNSDPYLPTSCPPNCAVRFLVGYERPPWEQRCSIIGKCVALWGCPTQAEALCPLALGSAGWLVPHGTPGDRPSINLSALVENILGSMSWGSTAPALWHWLFGVGGAQ